MLRLRSLILVDRPLWQPEVRRLPPAASSAQGGATAQEAHKMRNQDMENRVGDFDELPDDVPEFDLSELPEFNAVDGEGMDKAFESMYWPTPEEWQALQKQWEREWQVFENMARSDLTDINEGL